MLFSCFIISNGGKALRYLIHAVCNNDLKTQEKKDEKRNSVWPKRAMHEPTTALGWFCCNTTQPFPSATQAQKLNLLFQNISFTFTGNYQRPTNGKTSDMNYIIDIQLFTPPFISFLFGWSWCCAVLVAQGSSSSFCAALGAIPLAKSLPGRGR